ncbi:MAG: chitinase [Lachnospiraceae bacterium]|nr:chitinase [Lachnospiraceae bacterium]
MRRSRRGASVMPAVIIILLIIILGGIFGARLYFEKYSYSKEVIDSAEYFGISDPGEARIMHGDQMLDARAKLIDGTCYLDLETVHDLLNDRFYVGKETQDSQEADLLLYALPTELVRSQIGSHEWSTESGGTTAENYAPSVRIGDTVYLALDFVRNYANFDYKLYTDPNRIQLTTEWPERETAEILKDTQVRITGGIKSEILREIEAGEEVIILDRMETWSKVKTEDCFIGYVENKRLSDPVMKQTEAVSGYTEPDYATVRLDTKVNMAFHNVAGVAGNDTIYDYLAPTKAVNVVAPTWFWISDDEGNMTSFASQDYVDYLHGQGIQVWAVVDNFNTPGVSRNQFLTSCDRRSRLISQLMAQVQTYGIDGINVDFEQIDPACGEDFIEFIRELSIQCRKNQIILSVDNYVPYDFNEHYNLPEQGVFADYVVIMGYDEHYEGSAEAGSVASISYVSYGIQKALESIPAQKLMNAVPFYVRLWSTTSAGVTSQAVGMADARAYIENHAMEMRWDDACGQYYASSVTDTERLEVWLEDAQSIETKLSVMDVNHLAGVASWRLGFETPDIWDVIEKYMNR